MLRRFILVLMTASLAIITHPAVAGPHDELQGKWRAVEATSNGEPASPEMLTKLVLVFQKGTVSIMGAPPTKFTVDASFTPPHMDIHNSRRQAGIYDLRGDTLKICFGQNGDRPKAFRTEKYTDHTYMLLRRSKD